MWFYFKGKCDPFILSEKMTQVDRYYLVFLYVIAINPWVRRQMKFWSCFVFRIKDTFALYMIRPVFGTLP